MHFRAGILAAGTVFLSLPAHAGEELLFGPVPDWVVPVPAATEEIRSPGADAPVFGRLTDIQIRMERDFQSHFIRFELEFLNPQGLSAGNLSLPWRPDFDELTVHYVHIRRGDELIDVLDEGQTFTVLRREQSLEASMLNGVLTANMFPAGLEVGDRLEVAYTLRQDNPALEGHPETTLGPINGNIGQGHYRISWDEDLPVTVAGYRGAPVLLRGENRDYEFAAYSFVNSEPIVPPAGAPPRFQLVNMVEATTLPNWGALATMFAPLYDTASQIPAEGRLRDRLEAIRAATSDPTARAEMALQLVQDDVRYVALLMGEGSLVPADTATTWSRRYGDCKAKTALLLGLLRELGIEAHPVLVHSVLGDALPDRLPQVGAFDHVIVRARIGDRDYFLDGTGSGDTSLARLQVPHYTWGLPLVDANSELVRMVPDALTIPQEDMTLRFDASAGLLLPARADLEILYRDQSAVTMNAVVSQMAGQQRQQALEQFWRERFDFVTPESVDVSYDPAAGEYRMTLTGTAELDWEYNTYEPRGLRVGYEPDLSRGPGPDSEAPFANGHPFYSRTTHILVLPPGFSARQIDGEEVVETVAGVEYTRSLALEGGVFTGVRTARSVAAEISYAEAVGTADRLKQLSDLRVFIDIPPGYRLRDTEVDALSETGGSNGSELLRQGTTLLNQREYAAALGVFERATEVSPDDEWAWANRAVALAQLGRAAEAEAAIERAFAIDPGNWVAYQARGISADLRFDHAAAIAAYSLALERNPDSAFALRRRGNALVNERRFDEALLDAGRLRQSQPDSWEGYALEIFILARQGNREQATVAIDNMLARFSGVQEVQAAAASFYSLMGMESEAGARMQAAVDQGGPVALVLRAQQRDESDVAGRLADLDEALAVDPDFVPALLARAHIYWEEYRLEEALADADRAVELQPATPWVYDTRLMILMDMEDTAAALEMVDAMVERFPGDAMMLHQAANYYRELRRYQRSDQVRAQANAILPEAELHRRMREGRVPAPTGE